MAKVQLITHDERIPLKYEDTTFYIRRMAPKVADELREKATKKRGELEILDERKLGQLTLEHCIVGWEGIEDAVGNEAPFNKSAIPFLPPDIVDFILRRVKRAYIEQEKAEETELEVERKNSRSGSAGEPSMTSQPAELPATTS